MLTIFGAVLCIIKIHCQISGGEVSGFVNDIGHGDTKTVAQYRLTGFQVKYG